MSVNYGFRCPRIRKYAFFSGSDDVNDYFCYRHNQTNVQFNWDRGLIYKFDS